MAFSFDNSVNNTSTVATTFLSSTMTISALATGLFVYAVFDQSITAIVQINTSTNYNPIYDDGTTKIWFIPSPPSGSVQVDIDKVLGTTTKISMVAASYIGAGLAQLDGKNFTTGTGTSVSLSLTTTALEWVIGFTNSDNTDTAITGYTTRVTANNTGMSGVNSAYQYTKLYDSNGNKTAGSQTLAVTSATSNRVNVSGGGIFGLATNQGNFLTFM